MVTLVSADWVSEHIGRPGCLVIDPRSAMRYLAGHLRGAVSVPFKKLQGPDGRLAGPAQLAAAFGDAGLGDGVTPVLYDQHDGRNAAMAAWVLEYLGRTDVHVMDLLFESWKAEGREILYRPVPTEPQAFHPRPDASVRATLADAANPGPAKLLDTRTPEEFTGRTDTDQRPGHIPGAVNLPHSDITGAGGRLLIAPDRLHATVLTPSACPPPTPSSPTAAAASAPPSPGSPCARPATVSASTTAPTPSGWTAAARWKSDAPVRTAPLDDGAALTNSEYNTAPSTGTAAQVIRPEGAQSWRETRGT